MLYRSYSVNHPPAQARRVVTAETLIRAAATHPVDKPLTIVS